MKKKIRKKAKSDFVSDIDAISDPIEAAIKAIIMGFPEANRSALLEDLYGLCVVSRPEDEEAFLRKWHEMSLAMIRERKSTQEMAALSCMLTPIPIWRMAILTLISTYDPNNPKHVACVDAIMKDGPVVDSVKKAICLSILGRE